MYSTGIHAHPKFKLGRRAPKNAPALRIENYIRQLPDVPVAANHFAGVKFGLDDNDKFGVCGPTGFDNNGRLISAGLTGKAKAMTQAQVFDLYRASGNPDFDPETGADDNGVDLQTMLEAALAGAVPSDLRPVCFGRITAHRDDKIDAAVAIFGGVLHGSMLQTSQQAQTEAKPPVWDFSAPHQPWGGHCTMNGRYQGNLTEEPQGGEISWTLDVTTTRRFRQHQLQECWVVVFPWHLEHPAFLEGVDVNALRTDYEALTGRTLKIPAKVVRKAAKSEEPSTEESPAPSAA